MWTPDLDVYIESKMKELRQETSRSFSSTDSGEKGSVKMTEESACLVSSTSQKLYLDHPTNSNQVLLKLSQVILHNGITGDLRGTGQ